MLVYASVSESKTAAYCVTAAFGCTEWIGGDECNLSCRMREAKFPAEIRQAHSPSFCWDGRRPYPNNHRVAAYDVSRHKDVWGSRVFRPGPSFVGAMGADKTKKCLYATMKVNTPLITLLSSTRIRFCGFTAAPPTAGRTRNAMAEVSVQLEEPGACRKR